MPICQMGNKATKVKLTNILRGKERKKRKNRYAKLEVDKDDLYTLKINCKEKNSGRSKQGNKCRKNNSFKN